MKRATPFVVSVLVAGLVALSVVLFDRAVGQQASQIPTRVGLIDLDYVLKNYTKFNRLAEELTAQAKQKEAEIQRMQQELRSLIKQQQAQKPDSPLFAQFQEQATKKRAELEATVANAQRDFARKQAALYHDTYREVEAAVARYAQSIGLTLVIQTRRPGKVAPTDPQAVFREIARPVVYNHPALDITDEVLALLNRGTSTMAQPSGRSPLPAARRPTGSFQRR